MEDIHRIKIKIGPHEFETEGDADAVRERFQVFKELVALSPQVPPTQTQAESKPATNGVPISEPKQDALTIDQSLTKIMKVDGRVVSLTVRPEEMEDAALLLVYGQKVLRNVDQVTGGEVIDGFKATGGFSVKRVDHLLKRVGMLGDVIVTGEHRGKRYRLTNSGLSKARDIAAKLIAIVP